MLFDSHAHYDDSKFDGDRHELLQNLKNHGVDYVVNASSSMESAKRCIELTEKYDFIYASVGVHPHDVSGINDNDLEILGNLTKIPKVVAIGEIGLDFYYDNSPRDVQREYFVKQLDLANDVDLPVIIHSRDASQETFDILKKANIEKKGVIHCFSSSKEMAAEYVKMGYYIGIGGVITYPSAKKLVEVVKTVPIERILIETDCPYLAPVPKKGQRNDSTLLVYIVDKIAELKNMKFDEVAKITSENSQKLFFNKV